MAALATYSRQTLRSYARQCRPSRSLLFARQLSSVPQSSEPSNHTPWFMDPTDSGPKPLARVERSIPPHLAGEEFKLTLAPLPADLEPHSPVAHLHAELQSSPHLEPGTLLVREPIQTDAGPPLPLALPKGRRRRGGTYFGEGLGDSLESGGIWSWIVVAQVRIFCAPGRVDLQNLHALVGEGRHREPWCDRVRDQTSTEDGTVLLLVLMRNN